MRAYGKIILSACLASFSLFGPAVASDSIDPVYGSFPAAVGVLGDKYYRTELYCGRSKPDGGMVSDEEWEKFLADVVTPRFPDGFTILKGTGQYREKSGKIISEPSNVLVFLYENRKEKPPQDRRDPGGLRKTI
jgi:hypothetical protein